MNIPDPYRSLERDTTTTRRWIAAHNKFSEPFLKNTPRRIEIAARLKKLLTVNTISVPYPKSGLYFTVERKANQNLGILYVRKGLRGKKRPLIDQNKLSKDKSAVLSGWYPSPKGTYLSYGVSKQANDQKSIHILNIRTGKHLADVIPDGLYPSMHSPIAWNPDETGFWYARRKAIVPLGEEKMHQKIYYHELGDTFQKEKLVFGEDTAKDVLPGIAVSEDGRYLLAEVAITNSAVRKNDLYIKGLWNKNGRFLPVVKNQDALFEAWTHRERLYIWTNHKAPNWKLMSVPLKDAHRGMKHWKTVIPEGKHVIEYAKCVGDRLFVLTLENVHSVLRAYDLNGKFKATIPLPGIGSVGAMNGEREGNELFFGFSSFTMPLRVYRYDLAKNKASLFDEQKIDFDPSKYSVQQEWYRSKDGTQIPMFLIHKKGLVKNGKNPTLLYGYGGFGVSITPAFQATIATFVASGGVYAIANIRGGGEFGEKWHLAGTRFKKQNVFDDFAAGARWLIKHNYTSSQHLAGFGWSNGGLLMGAMITQHPELFKAIVVGAPVLDMLRYHKFFGGHHWISDYGDPEDPKMARALLKYSPYHNIHDGVRYPATLIVTAEGDDRVHPMHAYKFAARLEKADSGINPILIRIEGKGGHGGAASITKTIDRYADIYGFVFEQING